MESKIIERPDVKSNVVEFRRNENTKRSIHTDEFNITEREVSVELDDNKLLEKYMDKLDQDNRDQEKRISNSIQHMEQRITEERRLSEERMEERYKQLISAIESSNKKSGESIIRTENKFDSLASEVRENNKYIRSISISTTIAIAAIIITVAVGVVQLIPTLMQLMNK